MLFNSYPFIFGFLPIVLGGFYLLRRYAREVGALSFSIAASIGFYAYWNVAYVPLLLGSVLINYALGTIILTRVSVARKLALSVGVVANIAALGYFKYANFLMDQAETISGVSTGFGQVALPLAISFYTFQQIAYLVDCYRGQIRDNSLLRYVFVVTFFPHLIAGPIIRFREMAPQFSQVLRSPVASSIALGLSVFVIGLAKKVLIADYFGGISTPLFNEAHDFGEIDFVAAWVAALAYTLQLYFDFSGYSDMAIGLARMFGFRLAVNFLSPYKSKSIADFWRRWHVTLSRFLRDYLYVPLGGNRQGEVRTYTNLMATMAIGGLWHGAAWTFVAWGAYHGVLLAAHRAWRGLGFKVRSTKLAAASCFLAVVLGWVVFRSPDFTTAGVMLSAMFDLPSFSLGALRGQTRTV